MSEYRGFGMAEVKREGGKLWPDTYLLMNDSMPKREFYTADELAEHEKAGVSEGSYADYWVGKEL